MTSILSGIGPAIGRLFEVEPKPINETLEDQINKALAEEREKIRPSREDIDNFSWITRDNNPIHRLTKRAKSLGFDDIPVMGAHIAAYGEQFILGVIERMKEYWGADIKTIGQENRFRNPLYPGERILWQVTGFKQKNENIELHVSGSLKDKNVITITPTLSREYPQMPQIAGPIYSKRYLLEEEHLEEFYNCVGGKNKGLSPNMLPAAFVPATLLRLLENKTQTTEGTNFSMKYNFLSTLEPGTLQVDIFPPKKPKKREDQYIYRFKSAVSQNTRPVTYGEIVSSTPRLIDF
jgi:acyl dehydratase